MKLFRTIPILAILTILFLSACSTAPGSIGLPESTAKQSQNVTAAETQTEASAAHTVKPAYASGEGYPVEVTDFLGYKSTVHAAERIISLTPSNTQILMALGAEDRVIGVDAYSEPFLPGTQVVGDYIGPDVEKITALEPDVVLAANSIQDTAIEQLRSAGIPVVATEPTTWDQVSEGFRMIGSVVDNRAGAQALAEQLETTVDSVVQNAPEGPISCYYALSYGDAGNWTSGEGSFINAMMEYAGGTPITKGTASPWLEYPMEDLITADPDCIILGSSAGTIADFMNTAGYSELSAVRDGHVYEIDSDLVTIPSQNLNEGLKSISYIMQEAAAADAREAA